MTQYDVNESQGFVELTLAVSQPLPFGTSLLIYNHDSHVTNACELYKYSIIMYIIKYFNYVFY